MDIFHGMKNDFICAIIIWLVNLNKTLTYIWKMNNVRVWFLLLKETYKTTWWPPYGLKTTFKSHKQLGSHMGDNIFSLLNSFGPSQFEINLYLNLKIWNFTKQIEQNGIHQMAIRWISINKEWKITTWWPPGRFLSKKKEQTTW
jgi:hypothetical protein